MDKGKTINKDSYINDCLVPLVNTLKRQRPSTGAKNIKLHHDNARPHVHKEIKSFLKRRANDFNGTSLIFSGLRTL